MTNVLDEINPQAVELVPFTKDTLAPLVALGEGGILTATSLSLSEEISYEAYEDLATALGAFDRACRWWIGDLLILGENQFPDRYAQAASLTGLSEQTLLNRVWMARAISPPRRNHLVGYSCHREVAKLPPRQQTRWLKYAEKHGSTVAELKAAMKATRLDEAPVDTLHVESEPDADLLLEAAREVISSRQEYGADWLVPGTAMARLAGALGEE